MFVNNTGDINIRTVEEGNMKGLLLTVYVDKVVVLIQRVKKHDFLLHFDASGKELDRRYKNGGEKEFAHVKPADFLK